MSGQWSVVSGQLRLRVHFAFCILHFAFCISPFCLGQEWAPARPAPAPIVDEHGRASPPPGVAGIPYESAGELAPVQTAYGWPFCQRQAPQQPAVPRARQTYQDGANQQPQLPSVYQSAAPDLSKYALKSELQNYATKADLANLQQTAQSSLDTHAGVINELRTKAEEALDQVGQAKHAIDQHAAGLAEQLAGVQKVVDAAAKTPLGEKAVAAAGTQIDGLLGVGAGALVKTVFVAGGPWAAIAGVVGLLAYRRLSAQIQNPKSQIQNSDAAAGGGGPDPFRGLRGRVRPAAETAPGGPAGDTYRHHR